MAEREGVAGIGDEREGTSDGGGEPKNETGEEGGGEGEADAEVEVVGTKATGAEGVEHDEEEGDGGEQRCGPEETGTAPRTHEGGGDDGGRDGECGE